MPVSNENKSKFLEAINKYAEEQRNKIEAEVALFKEQELAKAETDILGEAYDLIQKEMRGMRQKIASEISRQVTDSRRALFAKRGELTDRVFEAVKQKLLAFTATADYPALLERYARALAGILPAGAVLTLRPADKAHAGAVKQAFGKDCAIEYSDGIVLGGIRGYHQALGRIGDETLDSKLEDQREWFVANCGMTIQ